MADDEQLEEPVPKPRRWRRRLLVALGAMALALAANMVWVDSWTRPAMERGGGVIVETNIEPVNVREDGEGPAVLLIHGFGGSIDWWDEIAPALAAKHRVIRFDLIGHGGTAAPSSGYSMIRQARLAATVLNELDIDQVSVIGHSLGGEVAVALASILPGRIEGLILIDSPSVPGTKLGWLAQAYLTPVVGEVMSHLQSDALLRQGLAQGFTPGFEVPEKFVADLRRLKYTAFRESSREATQYRAIKPTHLRLADMPVAPRLLVIFGKQDSIVPPEDARLFEMISGAKIVMLDGVGHSPQVEAPAETLKAIEDFLSQ